MLLTKKIEVGITPYNFNHYIDLGYDIKYGQRIVVPVEHLSHGSKRKVKCDICGKEKTIGYNSYFSNVNNYNIYCCSIKCSQIKTKKTCMKKYGVENCLQNQEIKDKSKATNLKKYGVEYSFQSKEFKEKAKQTIKNKYGVDHYSKTDEFKNNMKKLNLEKYGVENITESDYFKDKSKETCIEKYGVEFSAQSKEIIDKAKKTNLEKYGNTCVFHSKKNKEMIKKNNLKKYGVEYPAQNEKIYNKVKATNLERYGVECSLQNKEVIAKIKKTNLEKYGVENATQNEKVFHKQQINGFSLKLHQETNLFYRGTYEKDFLDFCFKNSIPIKKGKTIKYYFNEKNRIYFSDFYLAKENLIIEIKSWYTYEKELLKNVAKQKACLEQGYNFIFIKDKNYDKFKLIMHLK